MAKKHKYLLILLVLLTVVCLTVKYGNKTHYGISEGTYRMVTEADALQKPLIHFYMEEEGIRFVFSADIAISFAYRGYVELDGRVIAHCENGGEVWTFEILDNDTIRFVQKGSSVFMGKEGLLPDGAVFQYVEQK